MLAAVVVGGCRSDEIGPGTGTGTGTGTSTSTSTSTGTSTGTSTSTLRARVDRALAHAVTYLLPHQSTDGSFRSETYAAFKDGYSLTPLVAAALFGLKDHPDTKATYRRSVDFVATTTKANANYPMYALSLGALVLNAPGNERHSKTRAAFIAQLRKLENNGWAYSVGRPNLSATLFSSSALLLAGVKPADPTLKSALAFVLRCQNASGDGGFFFSPHIADGNKAGKDDKGRYRSYGSMTADGLRALLQLGLAVDHPRVKAAAAWLDRNFHADKNPGRFDEQNEVRRHSSYYYYAWSVAHAIRALGRRPNAVALAEAVLKRQRKDGSWRSDYSEMRENDPLVATSFAVAALSVARILITGQHRGHRTR